MAVAPLNKSERFLRAILKAKTFAHLGRRNSY